MKKMYNAITKKIALEICAMFGALSVQATTYTAVASGNFSSNTTWSGSVAPTVILAGDHACFL